MLPTVAPSLLEQNPKFKVLYNDLKVARLNEDGSSKVIKKQRAQDDLQKKLQVASIERARTLIVEDALRQASEPSSELAEDLRQVTQVICAQLAGSLTAEDREVVVGDFEYFVEHIEEVAEVMSRGIANDSNHIAALLTAIDDPTATAPVSTSLIQTKAQALRAVNVAQAQSLATKTAQLADLAVSIALINRELLQVAVRTLEQSMHGAVSRAIRTKAEHMATIARGMELKLAIISHDANPAYPLSVASEEGIGAAVQNYGARLRQLNGDTNAAIDTAERKLKEYEGVGKGLDDIAKKFAELQTEMTEVEDEIARLKEAD